MNKKLFMRYFSPAEGTTEGWERYSLPIGNGYFGASIFGGYDRERIQFTTNEFANSIANGGLSNFGELFIDFKNSNVVVNYERGLCLNNGIAYSNYTADGVNINREAFASYPDKVFAYKVSSDNGVIDFDVSLYIPYLGVRPLESGGRTGKITFQNGELVMRGTLPAQQLIYEARLAVITDGNFSSDNTTLKIENSTETVLLYTLGTSYKLCPEVFLDGGHKALGDDPHLTVSKCLKNAVGLGWENLYKRHTDDYSELIDRVEFDLGGVDDGRSTEELLNSYKNGNNEPYLEELYFAYGRHLLVSSSRKGTLPASLQGVWSVHDKSPWSSGFWHNINIQMNYWPAFSTNLAETFSAYAEYWKNYIEQAKINAAEWIKQIVPENYVEGKCGWIIGTEANAYQIAGIDFNTHSGPGTGGMTSKLFWDYYDFTRDENVLKEYTYPAVHGMAEFLIKNVKNYNGRYLCRFSASPEQILSGDWVSEHKYQQYFHTVGCSFDQQFIFENACDDLKCADILDISDEITEVEKKQLSGYEPIQIGYSGQIKEFDEEHFYGEFCEYHHRHISQLVALMPGSTVNSRTPAWLDAAKLTLDYRGDKSTGWALAHRFCAWARTGDGNRAYHLFQNLLRDRTYPNLWDVHPPFQIDGNFGATAGIAEMLLQSHEGYISLLPALPDNWKNISFRGLKARGNFTVSCNYQNGKISRCEILSESGGILSIHYDGIENVSVKLKHNGAEIVVQRNGNIISFETEKDTVYVIEEFKIPEKKTIVSNFSAQWCEDGVKLIWNGSCRNYAVYRAKGNESDYTLVTVTQNSNYTDNLYNIFNKIRLTYKIVAFNNCECNSSMCGAVATLHPADILEVERYKLRLKVNDHISRRR